MARRQPNRRDAMSHVNIHFITDEGIQTVKVAKKDAKHKMEELREKGLRPHIGASAPR